MKRFAFKMYLKPGCEVEYAKRHAAIWPEMVKRDSIADPQCTQRVAIGRFSLPQFGQWLSSE